MKNPIRSTREWGSVGLGRFELPTSRLSGVRSNQLSYRPFDPADRKGWRRAGKATEGAPVVQPPDGWGHRPSDTAPGGPAGPTPVRARISSAANHTHAPNRLPRILRGPARDTPLAHPARTSRGVHEPGADKRLHRPAPQERPDPLPPSIGWTDEDAEPEPSQE